MNQVSLTGKVASEPSMKYAPSGMAITEFVLETTGSPNRPNDKHKIVCFGRTGGGEDADGVAGWCAQFLHVGSRVAIAGKLAGQEFTTPAGKKLLNSQVNAFSVESLDPTSE